VKPHQQRLCPVIERMVGDMKIRHKAQATIDAYTYHVQRFAQFLGKPLQPATPDDVRNFQLHLIEERRISWSSYNQAVCGLRFLYTHTHRVPWPVTMVPFAKRPRRLPTVLSFEEVEALLQCTPNLKQRTFLTTLYAAGLRLSEAAQLRIPDIDSRRMQLNIARGKGCKQRLVPLSPRLLQELRQYWREHRPSDYLFPGKTPDRPYAGTSIQKAIKASARRAGIQKPVTPHVLRHSYAPGLLEAGVDLLTISRLVGHASFSTTMVYLLHTWNQKLEAHGHVHAVVPGGGPSLDGSRWISTPANYLVAADALRTAYRQRFLAGLERLWRKGQLRLEGDYAALRGEEAWSEFVARLKSVEWVSYIEPPPREGSRAENVLKYLGRYLTGGPISDGRILAADERQVTILAREGRTPGGEERQVPLTMSALEFTRRWALHVLPAGFTKTRHFGGWSNRQRGDYLERCARLLDAADAPLSDDADRFEPSEWESADEDHDCRCPACGGKLQLVRMETRRSWRDILHSASAPFWYRPPKLLRPPGPRG